MNHEYLWCVCTMYYTHKMDKWWLKSTNLSSAQTTHTWVRCRPTHTDVAHASTVWNTISYVHGVYCTGVLCTMYYVLPMTPLERARAHHPTYDCVC